MGRIAVALVSTVVCSVLVAPAAQASSLAWKENCALGVDCAKLSVPVDWAHGGATMEVSLARRKASGARIGTIVYLPGGPGDSGVGQVTAGPRVSPVAASRFDVIGIDPRGTNDSNPVKCDADLVNTMPDLNPDTGARYADVLAYSRKLGESCRAASGDIVDHLDSRNVARDVEALRVALGEPQITIYSRSYGTLAAQMYAEMYPGQVRALVLDSVFDHTQDTWELLSSSVRTVEDSFDQFARWCDGTTDCVLHGQDVKALFDKLYERAERGELAEPADPAKKISPTALSWGIMRGYMYNPDWPGLAGRLAALDGRPSLTFAVETVQTKNFPFAVACADHRLGFRSEQDWAATWQRLKRIAPTMRTHMAWQLVSFCSGWPLPVTNPQSRPVIRTSVLVLNSRHDPASSFEWAQHIHRMIRGSALVARRAPGHGVYNRPECQAVTDRYLVDKVLPAPGTEC